MSLQGDVLRDSSFRKQRIDRFLDTNGDGTGTKNAVGNYSITPETFYIQPPSREEYHINRMLVYVEDTGNFSADNYGALASPLSVGIDVRVADDNGAVYDLTDGLFVKSNSEWGRHCFDVEYISFGTGNNFMHVRWSFFRAGPPVLIRGDSNERLEVVLNDDLSGLADHRFMVQGYVSAKGT